MSGVPSRHDLAVTLPWLATGTAVLLDALAAADLAAPSGLPGWSGAHLAAHLTGNAEALRRLVAWGRTGVETPMYATPEARAAEIEADARLAHDRLRARVRQSAAALEQDLAGVTDWTAQVRSARGRVIPLRELPWMRVREVWLHAVDATPGATLALLPGPLQDTLLEDVAGSYVGRAATPRLVLQVGPRRWDLGTEGPPQQVLATREQALGWLTGRPSAQGRALPAVPPWL